jgi:hypothetical protein
VCRHFRDAGAHVEWSEAVEQEVLGSSILDAPDCVVAGHDLGALAELGRQFAQ